MTRTTFAAGSFVILLQMAIAWLHHPDSLNQWVVPHVATGSRPGLPLRKMVMRRLQELMEIKQAREQQQDAGDAVAGTAESSSKMQGDTDVQVWHLVWHRLYLCTTAAGRNVSGIK
jgi:hypothetical protein